MITHCHVDVPGEFETTVVETKAYKIDNEIIIIETADESTFNKKTKVATVKRVWKVYSKTCGLLCRIDEKNLCTEYLDKRLGTWGMEIWMQYQTDMSFHKLGPLSPLEIII